LKAGEALLNAAIGVANFQSWCNPKQNVQHQIRGVPAEGAKCTYLKLTTGTSQAKVAEDAPQELLLLSWGVKAAVVRVFIE
jgi:hypothetical protein